MDEFDDIEQGSFGSGFSSGNKKYPDTCPDCGASNPENSKSCPTCEKEFEPIIPEDTDKVEDELD
ncbi:MAG: hypothetical protein Q8P77_00970 [Candidatus Veblenbacteria bacterium]|nr:hypothetical protein [Candidatus Veblenbacteria bacterium]